ncbi:MAG: NAD(P)H-binding protein [Candidatus Sumerlaeia bacterium]
MNDKSFQVVTGAFGYTGKRIAQLLLEGGVRVKTLTHSPDRRNPFGGRLEVDGFHFDDPGQLRAALEGAEVLYNTYWVRFNHRGFTFAQAVANTRALWRAAREAGVRRVVHVSITNPSLDSPLEYFRGKAELEEALKESGLSYAILRPAVLFGGEDILINNIAWALRRLPVFGVFGDGRYKIQPLHVEDMAALAVEQGMRTENAIINAIGPETFTFRELVREIGLLIGRRRRIVNVPAWAGWIAAQGIGWAVRDVMLTRDEIEGLMAGLLYVEGAPPAGQTRLTDWAREHASELGVRYASELARRRDRQKAYEELK